MARVAAWILSVPYWPFIMHWHESFVELTPMIGALLLITPFVLPLCTFLGYLRDCFEEAVAAEPDHSDGIPQDVWDDLSNRVIMPPDWDGFERSVLKTVADKVKVSIRGGLVDITVCKHFA